MALAKACRDACSGGIDFAFTSRQVDRAVQLGDKYCLFVLVVNNSGSTILARILESHSSIRALALESQLLTGAFPGPDRIDVVWVWSKRLYLFRWTE